MESNNNSMSDFNSSESLSFVYGDRVLIRKRQVSQVKKSSHGLEYGNIYDSENTSDEQRITPFSFNPEFKFEDGLPKSQMGGTSPSPSNTELSKNKRNNSAQSDKGSQYIDISHHTNTSSTDIIIRGIILSDMNDIIIAHQRASIINHNNNESIENLSTSIRDYIFIATDEPLNESPSEIESNLAQTLHIPGGAAHIKSINIYTWDYNELQLEHDKEFNILDCSKSTLLRCQQQNCQCIRLRADLLITCISKYKHTVCCSHIIPWNNENHTPNFEIVNKFYKCLQDHLYKQNEDELYLKTLALLKYKKYEEKSSSVEKLHLIRATLNETRTYCMYCHEIHEDVLTEIRFIHKQLFDETDNESPTTYSCFKSSSSSTTASTSSSTSTSSWGISNLLPMRRKSENKSVLSQEVAQSPIQLYPNIQESDFMLMVQQPVCSTLLTKGYSSTIINDTLDNLGESQFNSMNIDALTTYIDKNVLPKPQPKSPTSTPPTSTTTSTSPKESFFRRSIIGKLTRNSIHSDLRSSISSQQQFFENENDNDNSYNQHPNDEEGDATVVISTRNNINHNVRDNNTSTATSNTSTLSKTTTTNSINGIDTGSSDTGTSDSARFPVSTTTHVANSFWDKPRPKPSPRSSPKPRSKPYAVVPLTPPAPAANTSNKTADTDSDIVTDTNTDTNISFGINPYHDGTRNSNTNVNVNDIIIPNTAATNITTSINTNTSVVTSPGEKTSSTVTTTTTDTTSSISIPPRTSVTAGATRLYSPTTATATSTIPVSGQGGRGRGRGGRGGGGVFVFADQRVPASDPSVTATSTTTTTSETETIPTTTTTTTTTTTSSSSLSLSQQRNSISRDGTISPRVTLPSSASISPRSSSSSSGGGGVLGSRHPPILMYSDVFWHTTQKGGGKPLHKPQHKPQQQQQQQQQHSPMMTMPMSALREEKQQPVVGDG